MGTSLNEPSGAITGLGVLEDQVEGLRDRRVQAGKPPLHDPHRVEALLHEADDRRRLLAPLPAAHDVEEPADLGVRQRLHELRVVVLVETVGQAARGRKPDGHDRERRLRERRVVGREAPRVEVCVKHVRARRSALGVSAARAVAQHDHRLMKRDRVRPLAVPQVAERVLRHLLDLGEERAVVAVARHRRLDLIQDGDQIVALRVRLPLRSRPRTGAGDRRRP